MFVTAFKYIASALIFTAFVPGCTSEKPREPKKPEAAVIVRQKPPVLAPEQRAELGFPEDLIGKVEASAGAEAEPFFVTVVVPTENLKGEGGLEKEKLAGFSVRTANADELIDSFRPGLRARGYLIFKSRKGYGSLPDTVSVVKGNSSYDLLKMLGTEAPHYRLDTKKIIAWLKQQQRFGSFVLTGAGPDWLEARFIKPPGDMRAFSRKVYAFAPDVLQYGPQTREKLVERMKKTNGFFLVWD